MITSRSQTEDPTNPSDLYNSSTSAVVATHTVLLQPCRSGEGRSRFFSSSSKGVGRVDGEQKISSKINKAETNESNETKASSSWELVPGSSTMLLDKDSYIRGLIVVKPKNTLADNPTGLLTIGSRQLSFADKTPPSAELTKVHAIMQKLPGNKCPDSLVSLRNVWRREEVFLPYVSGDQSGFYVYPWITNASKEKHKQFTSQFDGKFKVFVTAGCLFGSSIAGYDNNGYSINIVKHDIAFTPGQVITSVVNESDNDFSPYELVLFEELEKMACFIDEHSIDEDNKCLHYHLPSLDYMLFGIRLFIHKQMTFEALSDFIILINAQQEKHSKKVQVICESHNIKLHIASPFENLLSGHLLEELKQKQERKAYQETIKKLLSSLSIQVQVNDAQYELPHNIDEEAFVAHCVHLMTSQNHNSDQQAVWNDLQNTHKINTLEELFKIANATMIALASKSSDPYKVCSFLPVTEKQIVVQYERMLKERQLDGKYADVTCITYLPYVVPYGHLSPAHDSNTGLLFYSKFASEKLGRLIVDNTKTVHLNMLNYAKKNAPEIIQFAAPLGNAVDVSNPTTTAETLRNLRR